MALGKLRCLRRATGCKVVWGNDDGLIRGAGNKLEGNRDLDWNGGRRGVNVGLSGYGRVFGIGKVAMEGRGGDVAVPALTKPLRHFGGGNGGFIFSYKSLLTVSYHSMRTDYDAGSRQFTTYGECSRKLTL